MVQIWSPELGSGRYRLKQDGGSDIGGAVSDVLDLVTNGFEFDLEKKFSFKMGNVYA